MIELEQAQARLDARLKTKEKKVCCTIDQAVGCLLAEDVYAPISVPQFCRSGMDGYAVFSADCQTASKDAPVRLPVVDEVLAGDNRLLTGKPGTAVRIMTGAPIPAGYDCVVCQEQTDYGKDTVSIFRPIRKGKNYAMIGEDIKKNDRLLAARTCITPPMLGILASAGIQQVPVIEPLKVAIIATGSELAELGKPLSYGQIYNSNSYTIASYVRSIGGDVVLQTTCGDDADQFVNMLHSIITKVDLVFTTGGVSVGKKDFLPATLEKIGAERLFHKINAKPGTPILASVYKNVPVLSLSGNPFASLVNFHLFFWNTAARLMGNPGFSLKRKQLTVTSGQMAETNIRRFIRAYKTDNGVEIYTKVHQSSVFSNLASSNCVIDQPVKHPITVGDKVDVYYWQDV
ncbi:molybdopterin molybdotransferase MoeA [Vagococcus acidifermentans]|uniref:Molybdopterin molybdenumtransferase n=1 Tax=Vagococcus acidifermentans TaxID=564710 RepID=A0A430ARI4_9ENTE|nr:gephyrin-like molybdotransferase Glp [Vagococcus acidifermentans]RSU10668.1 hypothetical protein CBF27_10155 [Vagococcus acidifermentans]